MSSFDLNKCNACGKFKSWKGLTSCAGDCDDVGNFDEWFECRDCNPYEFKSDGDSKQGKEQGE